MIYKYNPLGTVKLETIQGRMEIQESILSGNMERATGQLNQLDPNVCRTMPHVYWHIQSSHIYITYYSY